MPVLPLDASTSTDPGRSTPRFSASSTIASAMRSFTLPVGLRDSSLAASRPGSPLPIRDSRTSGVLPTVPVTSSRIMERRSYLVAAFVGEDARVLERCEHLCAGLERHLAALVLAKLGQEAVAVVRALELDLDDRAGGAHALDPRRDVGGRVALRAQLDLVRTDVRDALAAAEVVHVAEEVEHECRRRVVVDLIRCPHLLDARLV